MWWRNRDRLTRAQSYVGNVGESAKVVGELQMRLLQLNGLQPQHSVLEIGCGALVAGKTLMGFLDPGCYVGIEPNVWLLDAAISEDETVRPLINAKKPVFLFNEDFDASAADRRFDYVLSHSILSHAAEWQLPQFMTAVSACLAPEGVGIVSIRFSDQNGNLIGDSHDQQWVYPGVSSFAPETVTQAAADAGLGCEWVQEYRQIVTQSAPMNFHDWIRLRPQQAERRS
jgi:hypothetical protein